jgi:peptidoglycan/LPS O-acetylase OafA/YrhL
MTANPITEAPPDRFFGLDVLRFVAVTLVLHIHAVLGLNLFHTGSPTPTGILEAILPPGRYGVDIFFVLSGFLVSGLLFKEYKRTGTVSPGRFFIRRAFKIYPAFWLLILGTVILRFRNYGKVDWLGLAHELFFIQNYMPGPWGHTWSLAAC